MSYKVTLVGAEAHEQTPGIAVYSVDARGKIGKKIAVVTKGQLDLSSDRNAVVAFGPDVEDASKFDPKGFVTVRLADQLPIWEREKEILLPPNWWRGWLGFEICVSGNTYRCFPFFLDVDAFRVFGLGQPIIFPEICQPLCNATVEVWRSTTCCWPFPILEVPKVIANLSAFLEANPVMFPAVPSPGPVERSVVSRVDAALGSGKISTSFVPDSSLALSLQTLEGLTAQDAATYFETHPSLWPFWCDTSSEYLGETAINPDGSFSFCYRYFPFFLFECRTSYFYKVKQFVNGVWQYIYDGSAAHQYFSADDVANLYAQAGQLCYQPPVLPPGTATLQQIGFIPAYDINSHWVATPISGPDKGLDQTQVGDGVMAALPQNAGLGTADGAPFTDTIWIMLNFDPGLKSVGAYYYRLSTVQADPSGSGKAISGATPQPILNAVAWNYQDDSVFPPMTKTLPLGPSALATPGLFIIPYPGDRNWYGNADNSGFYHQTLNTAALANSIAGGPGNGNGQFLLILELFDSSGNRLVPTGTGTESGDVDANFSFVRLIAPPPVTPPALTDSIVNFPSLTHILWVDNRPVVADIVNFQSSSGTQVCQTLTAAASAQFTVGYQAYHAVMCDSSPSPTPATTFISSYAMSWEKGLAGGTGYLVEASENVMPLPYIPPPLMNAPTNCPPGSNYVSTSAADNPQAPNNTFGNLLGEDTFCAFSITLSVQPKHTNGFSTIPAVTNTAAVALSIE